MTRKRAIGLMAGLVLLVAACGDDTDESNPPADSRATTTTAATPSSDAVDDAMTTMPVDVPQRIVSMSPTHTEMLFAIGAGDQVVAVDNLSTFPAETAGVLTDLSAYEPNVEAIAGYEPDLVITDGSNPDLVTQLELLDIPVWTGQAAIGFTDVYIQLEQLGATTGHIAEAAELVSSIETDLDEIAAAVEPRETPLSYYHELDPTYYSVTSDTFIGQVYGLFGLRNIADQAEGSGGQYPQLSAEFIISTSPDLVFLADTKCCGESAATVGARDGWSTVAAVANGGVVEMDDDIASRWGPRVVDYARAVAAAIAAVPVAAG